MIQAKPSELHQAKSRERGPNLAEQRTDQLIHWAAFGLDRVAERFHLLAKLSYGKESSRWSRMAHSVECAAAQLRIANCRYEELRRLPVNGMPQ